MFIAIPFLHERIGRLRWFAALISFMGALILLRPGLESFQWAAFFAFGAALCFGFESILIKKLSHTESPLQILTLNNIIGCILSLAVASLVWTNPNSTQWFQLAALGVIMVSAQALFIQSMKRSDASYALPFLYITLVFASVYDYFIFTTHPDWVSVLGAMTIVSGALLLGIGESVRKERGKSGSVK